MDKSPEAFRTISEVAESLETPAHVLRFWESRFPQIRPVKRAGGRRYYRPADVALLTGIRRLLHDEGMTIRGVQKILREQGVRHVAGLAGAAETMDFDAEVLEGAALPPALPEAAAGAQVYALDPAPRAAAGTDDTAATEEAAGEVVRLHPAPTPAPAPAAEAEIPVAPLAAAPAPLDPLPLFAAGKAPEVVPDETPEEVPEAGHVWVEDEPELSLAPPVDLFVKAPVDEPRPAPMSSGFAARIRGLPRPLSHGTRTELEELHSRLGLLHAQIAEAQRLRR